MIPDSIDDWNIIDNYSNVSLDEIENIGDKASSLILRNRDNVLLQSYFTVIFGAVDMIYGLEYHANRFSDCCHSNALSDKQCENYIHEASAYLNRMGQFYYFAASDFVSNRVGIPAKTVPTIVKLLVFRNKSSAHRSVDAPRKADTPDLQWSHTTALSRFGGLCFTPKPNMEQISTHDLKQMTFTELVRNSWLRNHLCFQIASSEQDEHLFFNMEIDHILIKSEAYNLIQSLMNSNFYAC